MPQKKKEPNPMENYIKNLIEEALEEWEANIKKEDADEIIKSIMPELETLVSKVVLKHLKSIAKYTLEKLKEE
jgi:glutamyl-tRNA reductase